jgi:hypothetical protein
MTSEREILSHPAHQFNTTQWTDVLTGAEPDSPQAPEGVCPKCLLSTGLEIPAETDAVDTDLPLPTEPKQPPDRTSSDP